LNTKFSAAVGDARAILMRSSLPFLRRWCFFLRGCAHIEKEELMNSVYLRPIVVSLLFISFAAVAAEEPIVVTATRTPQIADESLAAVIVIDRSQIEQSQALDIADLLKQHAGFDIARNGGPGQPVSLFLRGTNSNHVLVMVDGVKINSGTSGGAAFQNIDPDLIERIEIVKGPRSTLYGSDAVGGVINIITRRGTVGTKGDGYLGYGRYDTRKTGVSLHRGNDCYRAGIDLGYTHTDGFPVRTDSDAKGAYKNLSVNLYGGKHLGQIDMELSLWQAGGTSDYVDFSLNPVSEDYTNRVVALKLKTTFADNWSSELKLSRTQDLIDQNQSSDFAHTRRGSLDWQNNVQLGNAQLLTAGLYGSRETASITAAPSSFELKTNVKALYAQDNIDLGTNHFLVSARLSDYNSFGKHTTWDLEYGYHLSSHTRVTASVAAAFHAPDASWRFVGWGGDPNLKPETSRNVELGLHNQLSANQTLAISLFKNRIRDLLQYDNVTYLAGNIGHASVRGIEVSYDFQANPWGAHLGAIAQNPKDETTGEPLLRRAKRTLTASLIHDSGRCRVGIDWMLTSRRKDIDAVTYSPTYDAGYSLVNLTARSQLNKQWALQGRVENLGDKHYVLADGYNTAGRSLYVELRYGDKR
jgi:vitamin B12 transporter